MAEQNGEKSQDATPHRRQQARESGQVAVSHDLVSAAVLVAALSAVLGMGSHLLDSMGRLIQRQLGGEAWLSTDLNSLMSEAYYVAAELARTLLPILGLVLAAAVAANVLQTGFLFLPEKVALNWSNLSPLKGLGRILSLGNSVRLGFGIFKIIVVAAVAAASLWGQWERIVSLSGLEAGPVARFVLEIVLWTSLKIAVALLILAILDYGFQRWKYEQDLKMTSQEVREEMKNLQGDPQIISRRRQVQRQLVMNRLKSTVPKADVVITNPTELAVAIQYLPEEMFAPIVVAKGAGVLAQRIRKLALEHGIPVIENKPLARRLYEEVELHRPIPDQCYAAVAEVLAYVYQLKGKTMPAR